MLSVSYAVLYLLTLISIDLVVSPFELQVNTQSSLLLLPLRLHQVRDCTSDHLIHPSVFVLQRMSPVSMMDSVRSPGMTSSATVLLTTQGVCARFVCGVSTTLVLTEYAVWTYRMVMSVSNPLTVILTLFIKAG